MASRDVPDTTYSVDTDRVSLNVVYPAPPPSLAPAAGWQSASAEAAKPTPSAPGTPVNATTLAYATTAEHHLLAHRPDDDRSRVQLAGHAFDVPSNLLTGAKGLQLQWSGHGEPTGRLSGEDVPVGLPGVAVGPGVTRDGADRLRAQAQRATGRHRVLLPDLPQRDSSGRRLGRRRVRSTSARRGTSTSTATARGTGGGTALKAPYVRGNASITCDVCHDSHGSGNLQPPEGHHQRHAGHRRRQRRRSTRTRAARVIRGPWPATTSSATAATTTSTDGARRSTRRGTAPRATSTARCGSTTTTAATATVCLRRGPSSTDTTTPPRDRPRRRRRAHDARAPGTDASRESRDRARPLQGRTG